MQKRTKNKKYFENYIKCVLLIISYFILISNNQAYSKNEIEPLVTNLKARGFSLIPAPQEVVLGKNNIVIDETWSLESRLGQENIAYKILKEESLRFHNLSFSDKGSKKIILDVKSGILNGTRDPELNNQGYVIKITEEAIEVIGNGQPGLFYGVQSMLQLIKRNAFGDFILPECTIRDWPSTQLRVVHWDTKHNQKRMETLKYLIDWHAFFKVNMIAFEMEDKYEYPSNPIIGAPGAYTKSEMEELTKYALERNIQIVPTIQSPAHMAYVLKHEKYAHLKSDGSNYQICMCDPESIELIFEMYQDMIDATPGVDYFLVSTDEVYYAGICDKCEDPYNEENRSLAWAEFAIKAHDWLKERGRRMIAWVEYPLLPKHISLLPNDIINGVGAQKNFLEEEQKIGMRQLAYSSTQGAELLFPNHFSSKVMGRNLDSRLEQNSKTARDILDAKANLTGVFAAAWDDSGLHEETFQIGWATVAQYGWNPYSPTIEQSISDFMIQFYGQNSPDMVTIYKLLGEGARLYEYGWDNVTSTERGPGYGNSYGKGIGTRRTDEILSLPQIPAVKTLSIEPVFADKYKTLIDEVKLMESKNDDLIIKLNQYISQVERNPYNLEVFLSIAYIQRYFIKTVLTFNNAESLLMNAEKSVKEGKFSDAVASMVEASNEVETLINWSDWMWVNVTEIWEKSRYEKGRSVNGRDFVHVLDDVKDHFADRRKGLDYMIAPFQRMNIPEWRSKLNECINDFAAEHKVPVTGLEEVRLED